MDKSIRCDYIVSRNQIIIEAETRKVDQTQKPIEADKFRCHVSAHQHRSPWSDLPELRWCTVHSANKGRGQDYSWQSEWLCPGRILPRHHGIFWCRKEYVPSEDDIWPSIINRYGGTGSLLDVLAGRRKSGVVNGSILLNGAPHSPDFSSVCCMSLCHEAIESKWHSCIVISLRNARRRFDWEFDCRRNSELFSAPSSSRVGSEPTSTKSSYWCSAGRS